MTRTAGPNGAIAGGVVGSERPWKRAVLWLCFLGPFFFLSYGLAGWLTAQKANVGSIVYAWENHIPFLDWTIIPYWSIDALYGLSLFLCVSKAEIDTIGKRLLTAQVLAVLCFIAFPLAVSFERPATDGVTGVLFTLIEGFDRPFNQAPSLHIALLVILWSLYAKHLPKRWHWLLHGWFALIGISVLTTYQHHFIDVPTGALLGVFCIWLWPEGEFPALPRFRLSMDRDRLRLAAIYGAGSLSTATAALAFGGSFLWLTWPAVSLLLVSAAYAGLGEAAFRKTDRGRMSSAAQWLLAPYLLGAWINSRLWTRNHADPVHVADGVWIGRIPSARDDAQRNFASVVDLAAELPAPTSRIEWHAIPSLDLIPPQAHTLRKAAEAIERATRSGSVLVCCALGYSRSAAAVVTWLLTTNRATDMRDAISLLRKTRPQLVLGDGHFEAIEKAAGPEPDRRPVPALGSSPNG